MEAAPGGLRPEEGAGRREAFAAAYGAEWEGKDAESHLEAQKAGLTTTEEAALREEYLAAYGKEWEGRDVKDNLGPGMVPDAGAGRGIGFEGAYRAEWEGRDTHGNLAQHGTVHPGH